MKDDEQKSRRAKWREILDEYLACNLTQKIFCEQRNINLAQFVYYRSQFKREKEPQSTAAGFVPVKISQSEKLAASSDIRLSLPNGLQCIFPSYVDAAQIKRLVEALLSC